MSDSVLIVLIVAITVVVILVVFRRQLSRFLFKANRNGIEAEMETHKPAKQQMQAPSAASSPDVAPGVTISGNRQVGSKNTIGVEADHATITDNQQVGQGNKMDVARDNTTVSDNQQIGADQEIAARPDQPTQPS